MILHVVPGLDTYSHMYTNPAQLLITAAIECAVDDLDYLNRDMLEV